MAKARVRPKSWRYANTVTWKKKKEANLTAEGKPDLELATPPDFGGPEGIWSPEDLLVAAVNSCILTTFLYHQAKAGIELVGYRSAAEGTLVYTGKALQFTDVVVRPEVLVVAEDDARKAAAALKRSEETCLISNALNCAVRVEPSIQVAPAGARVPRRSDT